MNFLKNNIKVDRDADRPLYLQISNSLIHHIREGRLRRGLKLPGSREMASILGVNRMTVVAVYDELHAQGWVHRIPRKGTFVNKDLPHIKGTEYRSVGDNPAHLPEKPIFTFYSGRKRLFEASKPAIAGTITIDDGFPDNRLFPAGLLTRNLSSISGRASFEKHLRYGNPQGTTTLRNTLSEHLSDTRGLPVSPENIMITRGAQMGFYLSAGLLIQSGDNVIVGEPGFFGANHTFEQQGAVLNRVPVDDKGMDMDAVEKICRKKKIRLLYVIPHHHHPTTVSLTPERRIRLLELAEKHKFAIIEDDYDYDFHYTSSPMMPIASLDRKGSVIYIGTLAKTLAPAIRTGFMVGPESFIQAASAFRSTIDVQGDSLTEAAVAELYRDGTISRHIRKLVKLYRERRDSFCRLLSDTVGNHISFSVPDGGMSVWVQFNHLDLPKLSKLAADKGLRISDGRIYNTHTKNYNSARLGFASLNFEEQKKAVGILAECISELESV